MELRNSTCNNMTRMILLSCLIILSIAVSSGQQINTPVPGVDLTIEDLIRREVTRQIEAINNDKVKDKVLEEIRKDIDQIKKGKYKINKEQARNRKGQTRKY